MRSQDYLKQAADAVRQAVLASKQELDELRRSLADLEKARHDKMNGLKTKEKERLYFADIKESSQEKAVNVSEARRLRREESELENNYKRDKQLFDSEIAMKQRAVDELESVAQSLERRSAQINSSPIGGRSLLV